MFRAILITERRAYGQLEVLDKTRTRVQVPSMEVWILKMTWMIWTMMMMRTWVVRILMMMFLEVALTINSPLIKPLVTSVQTITLWNARELSLVTKELGRRILQVV